MVSVVKTGRNLIGGIIGAIIGWLLVEPCPWMTTDPGPGDPQRTANMVALLTLGFIVSCCTGLGLGAAEGINSGSLKHFRRSVGAFALVGGLGGLVGVYFGQIAYAAILISTRDIGMGLLGFIVNLIARTLGWGLWGAVTGLAFGMAHGMVSGSHRRFVLSAGGGVIGGAIGGFVFQLMSGVFTGPILRLVGFTATAAGIALFASLAQEMFKQAWVRVLVGRGEGREFPIDKPVTVIGRDELADVPLFGDMQIAKSHVLIRQDNQLFTAVAAAPGLAFAVNGQLVSSAPLMDGSLIRVGSRELEFHEKFGRAPVAVAQPAAPVSGVQPAQPALNLPPGTCPYCGQVKDAAGNCGCTVGGSAPQPMPSPAPGVQAPTMIQQPFAGAGGPGAQEPTQMFPQQGPTLMGPPQAGGMPAGVASLQVVSGPLAGRTIALAEGQTVLVGRAVEAEVSLPGGGFVSRRHASFGVQGGVPYVQDEGSSNGTSVNGARISRQALKPGDIVSIGQTQFRVV